MDIFTAKDFEQLLEQRAEWCVSLYLPTHRSLPEARQDPIRLKNLVSRAENALADRNVRTPQIKEYLKPVEALLDDPLFWRYQADGLAVFISADDFRKYHLPISFEELSVVSDRFHTKPLLPLVSSDDRFYVLALSKNAVRLIEATRYGAGEIELENVPASLAEILGKYDSEEHLQFHTRAQQAGGERAAVFHGQGGGTDNSKLRIREYFQRIDEGVRARLKDETVPLVLAGVESLFPIYREVNSYDQLLEEGITGNPESLSAEELRQRASTLVEPHFLSERNEAKDRFHTLAGTGQTANDLKEIVMAAHDGRVEVLFVATGVQRWGTWDSASRSIEVHEQVELGDRDLLDICAVRTLLNRGVVYSVESEAVPGGGPIAALFRY